MASIPGAVVSCVSGESNADSNSNSSSNVIVSVPLYAAMWSLSFRPLVSRGK